MKESGEPVNFADEISRAIDLSEKMIFFANNKSWEDFFELSYQREKHVDKIEKKISELSYSSVNDQLEDVSITRDQLVKLYDLNKDLLLVCDQQKNQYQSEIIKSRLKKMVASQYGSNVDK